jgi:hypothetical protein
MQMQRILQTDASLWKEKKTLCFSPSSKHYDTVWTGPTDGVWPTYLITDEPPVCDSLLILTTHKGQGPNILHLPMGNRLHLPTIHETFAHLPKWDGSIQHAVTLLAELLCYRVVSGPEARPLWLITQTNQTQEAQECLERNAENPLIDKIILLQETGMLPTRKSVSISKKVEERSIGRRLTYAEIMRTILTFPPDVLVVFANPTIFLDLGWKDLWTLNLENVCLALRRYELPASGNMDNPELVSSASPSASLADSQDCWVIRAEDVQRHPNPAADLDFPLGTPACSVFALRMLQKKFVVVNPARSLITWHMGSKAVSETASPIHHHVHPTGLNERLPVLRLINKKEILSSCVQGPDAAGWLHRLSKKGISRKLGTTPVTQDVPEVFVVNNCFETMTGLAFDSSKMYIGSSPGAQERWSVDSLYPLLPTEQYEVGLVAPLPVEGGLGFLPYFAKLLLLKSFAQEAEGAEEAVKYLCPAEAKGLAALFGLTNTIDTGDKYIVYKKAYCLPVAPTSKAGIAALRSCFWVPEVRLFNGYRSIVLMESNAPLEAALRRGYDVKVVDDMPVEKIIAFLSGAWAVVCSGTASAWIWLLPKGAHVLELSSSSTEAHDLSTISDLNHHFTSPDMLLDTLSGLE